MTAKKRMMALSRSTDKTRTPSTQKRAGEIVERIVRQFTPKKIILFGSHAHWAAGPDRDVDLLIVMSVASSKREKAIKIGVALHDIRIPKDLIVTASEEFEWRKDTIGTIEWRAWQDGKVLCCTEQVIISNTSKGQ